LQGTILPTRHYLENAAIKATAASNNPFNPEVPNTPIIKKITIGNRIKIPK
jgi:hypothetical protein